MSLVEKSGFTKRQIRFYITKGLVPSAGHRRGPNATYPHETLDRLLKIARLKQHKVPPTGRKLTLEEIRHELGQSLGIPDLPAAEAEKPSVAPIVWDEQLSDHLMKSPWAEVEAEVENGSNYPATAQPSISTNDSASTYDPENEIRPLLSTLQDVLRQILAESGQSVPASDGRWHRLTAASGPGDLEIHVRQPENSLARARLERQAVWLQKLLDSTS